MATTIQYINPLFFNNISPGIIEYKKTYPYVELGNSLLDVSGGTVEEYDNVTLLDAKKRGVLDPSVVGFYFRIDFTETFDEDSIVGKVGYYKKGTGTQVISSGTSIAFKYNLYLFKNNNDIPESGWYSKEDDDYQGELDYVEFSITESDYNNIKETKMNMMDNIVANTGNFSPGYSTGTWQYEHDDAMFNNHAVEFYFYIWEEINGPWFTQNGGTFTSGAWRTRDLNTEIADDDGIVSISSNQFTLQAGTYRISASACVHRSARHQLALYNVTDTSFVQKGINSHAQGGDVVTNGVLLSKFTITGAKVFEIQHRCQESENDEGFGIKIQTGNSNGWDTDEVYCLVEIFKEA